MAALQDGFTVSMKIQKFKHHSFIQHHLQWEADIINIDTPPREYNPFDSPPLAAPCKTGQTYDPLLHKECGRVAIPTLPARTTLAHFHSRLQTAGSTRVLRRYRLCNAMVAMLARLVLLWSSQEL
jgi:hypothetical protein